MEREKYTRVTEILNKYSGLHNVPEKILDGAKERGTAVHKYISGYLNALPSDIAPELQGYADSFHKIEDRFTWVEEPSRFYCDDLCITGEADHIALYNGKCCIVDFKTPLKESKSWALQGAAYKYLALKSDIKIEGIVFIKLDKFGNEAEIYEYEDKIELFLMAVKLHKYFYGE